MSSIHFYRPSQGTASPTTPSTPSSRPADRLDLDGRPDGTRNLAPYSFFNAFSYTPPIVGFSSTEEKDSARNARDGRVHLEPGHPAARRADERDLDDRGRRRVGAGRPRGAPSRVVTPARVAASPVSFECRVSQVVPLTGADGTPNGAVLTLGEVVGVHIDEAYLQDGVYQTARAQPVMRAGGPSAYYAISEDLRFDLRRPG